MPATVEPPASEDAQILAGLARDTLRAFEEQFHGQISWTVKGFPGMLTVDDAASREERVILEMLQAAFQERVHDFFMARFHEHVHDQQLADREAERQREPDYMTAMTKGLPKMMQQLRDEIEGRHTMHADDSEEQKRIAAEAAMTMERLGLSPPAPSAPSKGGRVAAFQVEVPPSEPAADVSTSDATRPPEDEGSGSG